MVQYPLTDFRRSGSIECHTGNRQTTGRDKEVTAGGCEHGNKIARRDSQGKTQRHDGANRCSVAKEDR